MNEIDGKERSMNIGAGFVYVVREPDDHEVKMKALAYTSLKGKCLSRSCVAVDEGSVLRIHISELPPHITLQGAILAACKTRKDLDAFVRDFESVLRSGIEQQSAPAKAVPITRGMSRLKTGLCRSRSRRT